MNKVRSADDTIIAFDQLGKGPALILVGGALEQRAMDSATAQLAPLLAGHFTVLHYDRRGRGDSTDTQPYAVEREIEDIDALINQVGGSAFLFGISSGAALAMEAAIKLGDKVKKLAMYEAPYNDDEAARQAWKAYRKQLADVLAQGRRGDALGLFMMLTGMPAEHLKRSPPRWPTMPPPWEKMLRSPRRKQPALLSLHSLWTVPRASFPLCTPRPWRLPGRCPMHSIAPWKASRTRTLHQRLLLCWWSSLLPTQPEETGK